MRICEENQPARKRVGVYTDITLLYLSYASFRYFYFAMRFTR